MSDKPEVKTEYRDIQVPVENEHHIQESFGMIPTVTATPTYTPRKFSEQFRINSTDQSLELYDQENHTWISLGTDTSYGGKVTSNAAGSPFPSGWSLEHPSTGNYTITHNLGTNNYVVVVMCDSTTTRAITITSKSSSSFNIYIKNSAGSDTDTDCYFIVKVEQ